MQSTPWDDGANGAHTKVARMDYPADEHTKDPLTGEAAMSCELRVSYLICAA